MPGDIMAYKIIEQFFFPDIAINSNADRNRSLLFLKQLVCSGNLPLIDA